MISQSFNIKEYSFFFSLTFYSGDDPFQWERTFLHLKFIDTFFVGNTALLREKHIDHHARSFCLFLPHSVRRKDEKEWHPAMAVHRSAQGLSQEGQTENITFLKGEGGQRPVRIGMSCAGMRMLAWILGYLLTLSMLMPSCCCAQCPQLCVIACFAHMPCASLRDSGRYWHSILCHYSCWGLLSHKKWLWRTHLDSWQPPGKEGLSAWRERNFQGALQGCSGSPNMGLPP